MNHERNNLKAGLFIVISIVLIIGVIVGVKGVSTIFAKVDTRRVAFALTDDVGGLSIGDPVRLGGVKVGEVKAISFEQVDGADPRVLISFTVPKRFTLREDAIVGIQGTITGSSWLNVKSLGKSAEMDENAVLVGRPSAMSEIIANLGEASPEIKKVLVDVRTQTIPKINNVVDGFKDTGPTATSALANVRDISGDSSTDIRGTFANLNAATGSIKDKVPPILDKVDAMATKITTAIDSATVALEDVKASLVNIKDITGSARSILARNRGKIETLIGSLKLTGDNLKAASAEIRRSPWRLLYQPSTNEQSNLNIYDAARQFADGASDLNDAAISLRDVLKDSSADPAAVQKRLDQLDATFGEFQTVEQKLWTSVKQ